MPPAPAAAARAPAYRALAVTVVTLALAYGVWYAYSVFLVALLKEFGSIFGATQVASALGSALGAWLAGRIFDATGSYAVAFMIAAGAAAVAALSVWASRVPRRS